MRKLGTAAKERQAGTRKETIEALRSNIAELDERGLSSDAADLINPDSAGKGQVDGGEPTVKFDPVDIFAGSATGIFARVAAVWAAVAGGLILPSILRGDLDEIGRLLGPILLLPLTLVFIAMTSGWWSLVAVPLTVILIWRALRFIHGDHAGSGLILLLPLSFMIAVKASAGRDWPWMAGLGPS